MTRTSHTSSERQKRVRIIESVKTPIGFFVLVVLVVEVLFGTAAGLIEESSRIYLVISMIALMFFLVGIVGYLAYTRPDALTGIPLSQAPGKGGSDDKMGHYAATTPLRIFPASKAPIPEYNALLSDALARASFYKYKGDKGMYLSYRLRGRDGKRTPNVGVEVLLLDVTKDELWRQRARELLANNEFRHRRADDVVLSLKKQLLSALLAFYDMRKTLIFDIRFYSEAAFLRYEITDELLVLSFLSMQHEAYYPPTLVYSKASIFYAAFQSNFAQIREQAPHTRILTNKSISEKKILQLAEQADVTCTFPELRALYQDYYAKIEGPSVRPGS